MLAKHQMLLRTPEPEADESFLGYIIRLTEHNGYEHSGWILSLAKLPTSTLNPYHSFMRTSSEGFQLLTKLSGPFADKFASLIYHSSGSPSPDTYLFFGSPVHRSFIRPNHAKVCPKCLREISYCRRVWEYALVTACPVHKCMLIDECPTCKRQIRWARNTVSSCPCKFDWREAQAPPVQEDELKLARTIYRLCGLSWDERAPNVSLRDPVLKLSLQDLARAVIFMAGQLRGLSIMTTRPLLSTGRIGDFHHLFVGAYYIFDDWPNHFYEFLSWWHEQERHVVRNKQRLRSVLYRDFGKLYTGIYKTLPTSQFNFIREAFLNYLVEEWEGCDLSSFVKGKDTGEFNVKYVSKGDAMRLLDSDDRWVNHLIEIGSLKTDVRSKGMKRLIFVDVADIANLMFETSASIIVSSGRGCY